MPEIFNGIVYDYKCNDSEFKKELYGDELKYLEVGNIGQATAPSVGTKGMQSILDSLPRWIIKQLNDNVKKMEIAIEAFVNKQVISGGGGGDMDSSMFKRKRIYIDASIGGTHIITNIVCYDFDRFVKFFNINLNANTPIITKYVIVKSKDGGDVYVSEIGSDETYHISALGLRVNSGVSEIVVGTQIRIDFDKAASAGFEGWVDEAYTAYDAKYLNGYSSEDFAMKRDVGTLESNIIDYSIDKDSWTHDSKGYYIHTYNNDVISGSSSPSVAVNYSALEDSSIESLRVVSNDFNLISFAETADGSIAFYCLYDAPSVNIPVKIELIEVKPASTGV